MTFFQEELYFSSKKETDDGIITEIYKLDFIDDTYSLLKSLNGDYNVFEGLEGIYLTTTYYNIQPKVLLYIPGEDTLKPVENISEHIRDIKFLGGGDYVATLCNVNSNTCKVVRFTNEFHNEKILLEESRDTGRLIIGAESVLVYSNGHLYGITSETITELSEKFSGDEFHYDYQGMYVYEGNLYDRNLNFLSRIAFVDEENYEGGVIYMYATNNDDTLVFQNRTTIRLESIGIEVSTLFIGSYFKHIYLIIAVFSIGGIILLGAKKRALN